MAWSIKDGELLGLSIDAGSSHFDSFTLCLLFVGTIHDVGKPPRISTLILRFFFKFLDCPLVDHSHRVNQIAANCGLSSIDMTDEHKTGRLKRFINIHDILVRNNIDILDLLCNLLFLRLLLRFDLILVLRHDLLLDLLRLSRLLILISSVGFFAGSLSDIGTNATVFFHVDNLFYVLVFLSLSSALWLAAVGILSSLLCLCECLLVSDSILIKLVDPQNHAVRQTFSWIICEDKY